MIRLIALAALLSLACRLFTGKWPWEFAKGPDRQAQKVVRARRMLGVEAGADAAQIREAHRRLAASLHPDRGGSTAEIQELNAARDLLLHSLPRSPSEPSE